MKRWLLAPALFVFALMFSVPAQASTNDSSRDCNTANGIKGCLSLWGLGGDLDFVRASITNTTEADFCGQLYVSKNALTDWRSIPECVSVGDKVVVLWDVGGHEPFPDGTVFCDQFVTDEGVLGGQPCLVTPIPPPPRQVADASGCNTQNTLKQCIFVKGFTVHVDYIKGTEWGIPTGSICGYEKLYKAGLLIKNSRLCVPKGAKSSGVIKWNFDQNWMPGTTTCTRYRTDRGTWSGKPCEEIGSP